MRVRISFFGLGLAAGLIVSSGYSYASDQEQCERATANEQQRHDACERIQRDSTSSPRARSRALFQLGLLEQVKPDGFYQALGILDAAVAADPTYVPAILARAEWFVLDYKGYEAVKLLEPALAANPHDVDLLVMTGRANAALKLPERALQFFSDALKVDPDHMRANYESGRVYEMANDFASAAEAYRKAGERYDPSYVSQGWIGIEHPYLVAARSYDRLGETGKALALLTNVIDHSPPGSVLPYVFEQRASEYEMLGSNNEAIADLTSALRFSPPNEHTPLLFKRAMLYQKAGRRQEAEEDFGRAIRNSDRRSILRMQVYLRNHGYTEVVINGVADPALLKLISTCLAVAKCGDGLGRPI